MAEAPLTPRPGPESAGPPAATPRVPATLDEVGRKARAAVFVAFIGSGFAFASWASRIPQVRDGLDLQPGELGLVLLAIALGSVIALPSAGVVVTRFGASRTVASMALLLAVGLFVAALGQTSAVLPVVVGLFLLGFANGSWDVAMNVEGAAVEHRLQRSIMSRFHAGFSVGTVGGAVVGAVCVALRIPVAVHLSAVAVAVAAVVPYAVRNFLPAGDHEVAARQPTANGDGGPGGHEQVPAGSPVAAPGIGHSKDGEPAAPQQQPRHPLRAWTERRTLLIGLFVLTMAFAEGTGNDWLGVAVIDGYGVGAAWGTITFALFLSMMTLGRWFGPGILERFGRVRTVRVLALVALAGLLLVVFGGSLPVAMFGSTLWGLGSSLGFPVGMSAAADDPVLSAGRVSVVASIGYVAFLAGPPLIGFLGDQVGVLRALTVMAGLLGLALMVAGSLRPLVPEPAMAGQAH